MLVRSVSASSLTLRRAPALRSLARSFFGGASSDASPVPLGPGEILLCNGGTSTSRTYLSTSIAAFFLSVNVGVAFFLDGLVPDSSLHPALLGGVCAASVAALATARATSRALVRAAVLEADGAHLRVYPYGLLTRPGAPVSIPIRLMRESESPSRTADAEAVHAHVCHGAEGALSRSTLCFDKPLGASARVPRAPGSGLVFDARGLTLPSIPLGAADDAAFRTYALLVWILRGNVVGDMTRVIAGDWSLEDMALELSGARAGGAAVRAALFAQTRAYWKKAVDKDGRTYYYNELDWRVSWTEPTA